MATAPQDSRFGPTRWQALWAALGAPSGDEALRVQLLQCYGEPQRSYHTLLHLAECFAEFDGLQALAARPAEIELALWFHDAIYDTRRKDNEQRSADWAQEAMLAAGLADDSARRVVALVLATRHLAAPAGLDEQILIDVDLAILGAEPARFAQYEQQVGLEYAWVPEALRRPARRRLLLSLLERDPIYSTAPMRERLERRARDNLRASVAALERPL
jgi:predicted metal-dependent HD superfamily phosphohydrolase